MKILKVGALALVILTACKKNPIDRLVNPVPEGDVPLSSGVYVIYNDELKTGGGAAFIPGGPNQALTFQDTSSPRSGFRQINYVWNGNDVANQHLFAGFQLLITPDGSTLASATGKNLSAAGYTSMRFLVRGHLSEGNTLRIEGPGDGNITAARTEITAASLTNSYQQVVLTVPSGDFSNVKIFATFSIQYDQPPRTTNAGQGGTIFIDDITYQ